MRGSIFERNTDSTNNGWAQKKRRNTQNTIEFWEGVRVKGIESFVVKTFSDGFDKLTKRSGFQLNQRLVLKGSNQWVGHD